MNEDFQHYNSYDSQDLSNSTWRSLTESPEFNREELVDLPKTRGRPRKYHPKVTGKTLHRMDDDPIVIKHLPPKQLKLKMIKEWHTLTSGTAREKVQKIADRFGVSYSHAHQTLKEVL